MFYLISQGAQWKKDIVAFVFKAFLIGKISFLMNVTAVKSRGFAQAFLSGMMTIRLGREWKALLRGEMEQ